MVTGKAGYRRINITAKTATANAIARTAITRLDLLLTYHPQYLGDSGMFPIFGDYDDFAFVNSIFAFIRNSTKRIMGIPKMDKVTDEKFNKLLTQYKTLSVERLEVEKSICQAYEVTVINGAKTLTAESLKEITELRKRLSCINKEMKKIDNKILKMWITPNSILNKAN